jgi:hypothetical protein
MRLRNKVAVSVCIFVVSYVLLLLIWIQIKPYYGGVLTHLGAHLAGTTAGAELEKVIQEKDVSTVSYARTVMKAGNVGEVLLDFKISVSNYSFNVPLSFALIAALFVFLRWHIRYVLEVSLILVLVHVLYIYSYCTLSLFREMANAGLKNPGLALQFGLQFVWAFTDNMVIRFEPFLVAAYLWLREMGRRDNNSIKERT